MTKTSKATKITPMNDNNKDDTMVIAIEIGGERYETVTCDLGSRPHIFDDLFRKADIIEEDESLVAVNPQQKSCLSRLG